MEHNALGCTEKYEHGSLYVLFLSYTDAFPCVQHLIIPSYIFLLFKPYFVQVAVVQMLEKQMGPESFRRVRFLDIYTVVLSPSDYLV